MTNTARVIWAILFWVLPFVVSANADGIVSQVVSAPVAANGILRDERSGINIYLQTDQVRGLDFMDPKIPGYGLPPGGSMEVEMVSGFQRDKTIPLDDKSILLVVGTPQQGVPDEVTKHTISEGENENTFVIKTSGPDGLRPDQLISPAPGAAEDPIRAKGIKIIHVGRVRAFVSRGERGVVAVRIKDRSGNVIARGSTDVEFFAKPSPQIFLTNIPHGQRNHNWQRLGPGQVVGAANNTLPLPLLLYDRNEGLERMGIVGAGVLSKAQLIAAKFEMPLSYGTDVAALIFRDTDEDKVLNPATDQVIGIVREEIPQGASGQQLLTPLVNEMPFLSVHTSNFNERAGHTVGGAIMQVVYIAGDTPGIYRLSFSMFSKPGDMTSPTSPPAVYTVVVE